MTAVIVKELRTKFRACYRQECEETYEDREK